MNQISRICPVTDAEAERIARHGALADLAAQITAVEADRIARHGALADLAAQITARDTPEAGAPPRTGERRAGERRRWSQAAPQVGRRRRWLLAAPVAAGLAVAALIVAGLAGPGHQARP